MLIIKTSILNLTINKCWFYYKKKPDIFKYLLSTIKLLNKIKNLESYIVSIILY